MHSDGWNSGDAAYEYSKAVGTETQHLRQRVTDLEAEVGNLYDMMQQVNNHLEALYA